MCAWPKGKPRKGHVKKITSFDDLTNSTAPVGDSDNVEQETDDDIGVITVNADKTWGIIVTPRDVMVQRRNVFKTDTAVSYPSQTGGMTEKIYRAGEFGPWDKQNRVYYRNVGDALDYIANAMVREKLRDAGDIKQLAKIAKDVKNERVSWSALSV